jgi:hypothetical protein
VPVRVRVQVTAATVSIAGTVVKMTGMESLRPGCQNSVPYSEYEMDILAKTLK